MKQNLENQQFKKSFIYNKNVFRREIKKNLQRKFEQNLIRSKRCFREKQFRRNRLSMEKCFEGMINFRDEKLKMLKTVLLS